MSESPHLAVEGGGLTADLLMGGCAASKAGLVLCWLDASRLKELTPPASSDELCMFHGGVKPLEGWRWWQRFSRVEEALSWFL